MHRQMQEGKEVDFHFYDDKGRGIIEPAFSFFVLNPNLIPSGMNLQLHFFCPHERPSRWSLPSIRGTGKTLKPDEIERVITNICRSSRSLKKSTPGMNNIFDPKNWRRREFETKVVRHYKKECSTSVKQPTHKASKLSSINIGTRDIVACFTGLRRIKPVSDDGNHAALKR